jgi:hypothetical protein
MGFSPSTKQKTFINFFIMAHTSYTLIQKISWYTNQPMTFPSSLLLYVQDSHSYKRNIRFTSTIKVSILKLNEACGKNVIVGCTKSLFPMNYIEAKDIFMIIYKFGDAPSQFNDILNVRRFSMSYKIKQMQQET